MLNGSAWDALVDPLSEEESRARAAARRARLEGRAQAEADARMPAFAALMAREPAPAMPDRVIEAVSTLRGVPVACLFLPMTSVHDRARDETIYWLLGLSPLGAAEVARGFDLVDGEKADVAMRRHARAARLPVLDLGDGR